MLTNDQLRKAITHMQKENSQNSACIGFDGYVDTLYRVVRNRHNEQLYTAYDTIEQFAERVAAASGRSADIELLPLSRCMGGNAPLMAQAMACLQIPTRCIGTMGYPEFASDDIRFIPCSTAPCAESIAFEFLDGKLMFGTVASLQALDWSTIQQTAGLDNLIEWYRICRVWGVVNWSFVLHCNNIIISMIQNLISRCTHEENRHKILFFDLADPSARAPEDIHELCRLLQNLCCETNVILGLNENEIMCLSRLLIQNTSTNIPFLATALREKLGISAVVVHGLDYACAATQNQTIREESCFCHKPVVSTGGGDHFNAGLCAALAAGLTLQEALAVGNLVASFYVSTGFSPELEQLIEYAKEYR